ncbi:MAG: hypothetical protein D6748_09435 [Calditrichaeota bacterium]|nr:MAG: hypothetical protein D6748_09435 [Calditrichota bacterium]
MKKEPNSSSPPFEKALHYEQEGDFSTAFDLFRQSLEYDEIDIGDALFHCGWCLEQAAHHNWEDILNYYEQAAEKTSMVLVKMNSYFRSGWLWLQEKQYQRAGEHFRKAVEFAEEKEAWNEISYSALYWYAVVLEAQGRYLDALSYHRKLQTFETHLIPESRFREIQCLIQIGAYSEALEVCKKFQESPPDDVDIDRFNNLKELVLNEQRLLEQALDDNFLITGKK